MFSLSVCLLFNTCFSHDQSFFFVTYLHIPTSKVMAPQHVHVFCCVFFLCVSLCPGGFCTTGTQSSLVVGWCLTTAWGCPAIVRVIHTKTCSERLGPEVPCLRPVAGAGSRTGNGSKQLLGGENGTVDGSEVLLTS